MLIIRYARFGKRNQPFFRIIVTDQRKPPKGGRFVEEVGYYNPLTKEKKLKKDRVEYWMSVGAKPSDSIHNLLISEGVMKGRKIDVHKKSKKKEEEKKEVKGKEKTVEEGKVIKVEKVVEEKKEATIEKSEKPQEKKEDNKKEESSQKEEKPKEVKEEIKKEKKEKSEEVSKKEKLEKKAEDKEEKNS